MLVKGATAWGGLTDLGFLVLLKTSGVVINIVRHIPFGKTHTGFFSNALVDRFEQLKKQNLLISKIH